MVKHGHKLKCSAYTNTDFGRGTGAATGRVMCSRAIEDSPLVGLFHSVDRNWRRQDGTRPFGATYRDLTPGTWARNYLGIMLI